MSHPLLTRVLEDWLRKGSYVLADHVTALEGAQELVGQAERDDIADRLERALDVCQRTWVNEEGDRKVCGGHRRLHEPLQLYAGHPFVPLVDLAADASETVGEGI